MAQVLVRDLEEKTVKQLKLRASQHGRSLQSELRVILEQAARTNMADAKKLADRLRCKLLGRQHSDSARLLAEDRER